MNAIDEMHERQIRTLENKLTRIREALEQLADDKGSAYWTPEEVRKIARNALDWLERVNHG